MRRAVSLVRDEFPVVETKPTLIWTERIEIQDATTGQTRVYNSLDEVPAEYREELAALRESSAATAPHRQHITVRDANGVEHTYNSLEEIPPHLRQLIEQARRS